MTLAILAAAHVVATAAPILPVDEAVRIAEDNSYSIKIRESARRQALDNLQLTRGGLGPRVILGANYTRFDRPSPGPFAGPIDQKSLSLTVGFSVDIGGYIGLAVKAASAARLASDFNLKSEINGIKGQVRTAYYQIVFALWGVRTEERGLENARARLKNAQAFFEQGALARFDVLRLETEVTRAEARLVEAQNQVTLSKAALNNLLARPVGTDFEVEEELSLPLAPAAEMELSELAQITRPEIQALRNASQSIEFQRKGEKRATAPQLEVGLVGTQRIDKGPFERENGVVGQVNLTWTLLDSGVTKNRMKSLDEQRIQNELLTEQTQLAIRLQVRQARLNLDNAAEQLRLSTKQLTEAQEGYRLAALLFDNGRGILLDVTTAQENLLRAEGAFNIARFSYLTAYAALQQAVGRDDLPPMPTQEQ